MSKYWLPPEWEKQSSVWLSWPHNKETWEENVLQKVEKEYLFFVEALADVVRVKLIVPNATYKEVLSKRLSITEDNIFKVDFIIAETNDAWIRDYGPDFILDKFRKKKVILNWEYNSWGEKYPPFHLDNNIPLKIGELLDLEVVSHNMVLEGGSFDVNGCGDLLTTRSCLLNPNRNPKMDIMTIEEQLKKNFGVQKVHWLEEGIKGDDTDGHIDDIVRFVNETTITYVYTDDKEHPDYEVLQKIDEQLHQLVLSSGVKPTLIKLPVPEILFFEDEILPCSYANFLITNKKVLVPTFNCLQDNEAISTLQELFKEHKVIGIPSKHIIIGLGNLHCLSKQEFEIEA